MSEKKNKKYKALFTDGTITHFGAKNYDDYTTHKDDKRKMRYINRHKNNENWYNPKSAGALSRWILWNKKTMQSSINDYVRMFNL
jgi:hypothetical protein